MGVDVYDHIYLVCGVQGLPYRFESNNGVYCFVVERFQLL